MLLNEVRDIETAKLTHLMAENAPVREPIAAGASRFDEQIVEASTAASTEAGPVRRALLVIDAGAGTTDFALFQVFWYGDRDETRYALIAPAVRMCRVAGNAVDEVLRPIILAECGVDPKSGHPRSDEDFGLIKLDLSARIRDIKRDLFTNDNADIELRPNVSGMLPLDTVLNNGEYKRLGKELCLARDTLIESAFGNDQAFLEEIGARTRRLGRSFPIHVLLTGGSSVLPIVQKLAEGKLTIGGIPFAFVQVTEHPKWIESLPRDEADLVAASYPQCAVAIGGSARELPEELPDLSSLVTPPRSGKRVLERYQVTGVG
jgi:molecular chaperone HscA